MMKSLHDFSKYIPLIVYLQILLTCIKTWSSDKTWMCKVRKKKWKHLYLLDVFTDSYAIHLEPHKVLER